jgi:penicillin-binding protein 1C
MVATASPAPASNVRGDRRQMKSWHAILSAIGGAVALIAVGCGAWAAWLGPLPAVDGLDYSHVMLDHNGKVLRAYANKEGRWRLPATPDQVDPLFLKMLFAYEDKRFYEHHGVDLLAMTRALFQLITEGHIVSGGSTLTMQVARLLEPRQHRSFYAKLRQITRALQLEQKLSKNNILSLYFALAPYGGNLEGIRAASLAYFGQEPKSLTVAEAALLVALPQAPEARRPDRYPDAARAARNLVLDRVAEDGVIPADEVALAKRKPVPRGRRELPALAAPAVAVRSNPPRGSGLVLRRGPAHSLALQTAAQQRLTAPILGVP